MLVINDFSPFVDMTEGEFFDYFKDKCSQGTPIRKIYRDEIKKLESVRISKTTNKQRKKTKPEPADS
jgi:hypothetical protein